jgi:hypothetical protein
VLWICTGQQRFDTLGRYGNEYVDTPNVDRLAEEGATSPVARVRRTASSDGVHFDDLEPTWHDPRAGLEYRPTGGVDYGAFPGDEHGHLPGDRRILVYYQARHDYRNNRPDWRHAGDSVVVMAGRFTGPFEGVPTTVDDYGYAYHEFPMHTSPVDVSAPADTAKLELIRG